MKKIELKKIYQILWSMFAGAALVFVLYAILLISAGGAKADVNSYLKRLEMNGYYGPIATWITIGNFICTHPYYSDSDLAYAVVDNTGPGVYMPEGYQVVYIAREELCSTGGQYMEGQYT